MYAPDPSHIIIQQPGPFNRAGLAMSTPRIGEAERIL